MDNSFIFYGRHIRPQVPQCNTRFLGPTQASPRLPNSMSIGNNRSVVFMRWWWPCTPQLFYCSLGLQS